MALISIEVTNEVLARELDREQTMKLIQFLDLRQADVDFTIDLLKHLVNSLENDMDRGTIAEKIGF